MAIRNLDSNPNTASYRAVRSWTWYSAFLSFISSPVKTVHYTFPVCLTGAYEDKPAGVCGSAFWLGGWRQVSAIFSNKIVRVTLIITFLLWQCLSLQPFNSSAVYCRLHNTPVPPPPRVHQQQARRELPPQSDFGAVVLNVAANWPHLENSKMQVSRPHNGPSKFKSGVKEELGISIC